MARKTLLEAQTDARQAMEKLTENKAECSREHHTITTETEAVQEELRKTTERNLQNQEVQVAKTDAMGCRIAELTDLLDQRESRMETQMRDMCAQIQNMNATLLNTKPTADRSRSTFDKLLRDTEVALSRARDFTPKPRECIPKPTVQISSTRLPTQASASAAGMRISPIFKPNMPSTSNTRDIGYDPMSLDTSMTEITHPWNRSGPGITNNEGTTN